jgi:hypothetical protein
MTVWAPHHNWLVFRRQTERHYKTHSYNIAVAVVVVAAAALAVVAQNAHFSVAALAFAVALPGYIFVSAAVALPL